MKVNLQGIIHYFSMVLFLANLVNVFTSIYNTWFTSGSILDIVLEIVFIFSLFGNVFLSFACHFLLNYKKDRIAGRINHYFTIYLMFFFLLILATISKIATTSLILDREHPLHILTSIFLSASAILCFVFASIGNYKVYKTTFKSNRGGNQPILKTWSHRKPIIDKPAWPLKVTPYKFLKAVWVASLFSHFVISIVFFLMIQTGEPPELTVDITQITPLLIVLTIITTTYLARQVPRSKTRRNKALFIGIIIAGGTVTILNAFPTMQLNDAVRSLDTQFASAFGNDWEARIPGDIKENFRTLPFFLKDVIIPINIPEVDVEMDVHYTFTNGTSFKFDWYAPLDIKDTSELLPVVIAIHGGFWSKQDKGMDNLPSVSKYIANQGYVVADISYGLFPEYKWKDMLEQIGNLTKFLDVNPQYHANVSQAYFLGRSAGAHLALVAGLGYDEEYYTNMTTFSNNLNCLGIIPFYPPTNTSNPYFDDLAGVAVENRTYYNPVELVSSTNPPSLIFQGQYDKLIPADHLTNFKTAMGNQGSICIAGVLPSAGHSMDGIYTSTYSQVSLYYIERFLALTNL
ncbi:MAG: alpha/beta hydrolase fold domain-containing protein [Candidatus Hodarchaeota archaeon]